MTVTTDKGIMLGTRAEIRPKASLPTEELLAIARERAPDGTIFDSVDPFFWQVRASSNRLDFYDTRMRAGTGKTLDNFARALAEGVSYQDSHNTYKNGWGQSLTGRVVVTDETDPEINEKITEVWGELFTIPGLTLANQSTDSMIAAIRSGIWRDVSVGFYATDIECSICGKQSFQWWKEDGCQHIPGYTYTFKDQDARAFAWINDGELVELSQVYKGATPSAAVLKAEQMSDAGMLSDGERNFIERRHGVRLVEPTRTYALGLVTQGKEQDMDEQEQKLTDGTRASIVEALKWGAERKLFDFDAENDPIGESVHRAVRAAQDAIDRAVEAEAAVERLTGERDEAKARIAELEPQANDGKRYREDLIADTLTEGARAFGKDFREDMYRALLEAASIDQIRGMKEDFTRQGDAVFARKLTVEKEEQEGGRTVENHDPERYKG